MFGPSVVVTVSYSKKTTFLFLINFAFKFVTILEPAGRTYGDPNRERVPGWPGPYGHISQVRQKDQVLRNLGID